MRLDNRQQYLSIMYYACFAVYSVSNALTLTNFRTLEFIPVFPIYSFIRILCAIFLSFKILIDKQERSRLIYLLPVFLILGFSTLVSGTWNLAILLLFAVASNGIEVKSIAKLLIYIYTIIVIITSICAKFGIISSYPIKGDGGLIRDPMGFTHPNTFSAFVVVLCCAFAVIRFSKFSIIDLLLYLLGFYLSWSIAYSRTASICVIYIASLAFIFSKAKDYKLLYKAGAALFFLECVTSLYLMVQYNSSTIWMNKIDKLLSGRFDLAHYFYKSYGVTPFGVDYTNKNISYNGYSTFVVDNAFCHILLESGYLISAIFLICYFACMIVGSKSINNNLNVYGLILFIPVAFSETVAFLAPFNFSLIFIYRVLINFSLKKRGMKCL